MSDSNIDNHIVYDEEEDEYYYIGFPDSSTNNWVQDLTDPWDWVIDDDIPFDINDLEELFEIIDPNKDYNTLTQDIKNFLKEKGIEEILREKGIEY